jgi:hypothetical protein
MKNGLASADGGGAAAVLSRVTPENRYVLDQQSRVGAIEPAVEAGILEPRAKMGSVANLI